MIGGMARLARLVAVSLGVVLVTAAPAGADPAGPSDFRSEVTGIVPGGRGRAGARSAAATRSSSSPSTRASP